MISLFLGGARSGKSQRVLITEDCSYAAYHFIATAEVTDDDLAERIAKHKAERGRQWQTLEAPVHLVQAIQNVDQNGALIVVDCLTVWLGNLMHHQHNVQEAMDVLIKYLPQTNADIRLVSNEVGLGIVPETSLGRQFRDLQGRLNQDIAAIADRVELMVAGIPMVIKSNQ